MLKQITFIGFKSFADKVVVDFSDGITGVIGPNGCGKSNIFDGIRWVLGEQSAKSLRGGKMEDVIFAGAESRKPGDFAEVTLVLDNSKGIFKSSDEEEITVSRRTNRNGGSEYTINHQPSRLKDIHDLFLDSGIGSNSYSMIGQGQIEKILSTKVEERRAIFEEASGIVKLRQRKESTEKRLLEVNQNMLRIEDVVKEIERQLFPLREQALKTEEYNQLSSELKNIEVQYLIHQVDELDLVIKGTSGDVFYLNESIIEMDEKMDGFDQKLEELKTLYQSENDRVFTMQEELSMMQTEIEKKSGNKNVLLERIENTQKNITDIEHNLKEIEENFSLSTEDFRSRQERLKALESLVSTNEELLRQVGEDISLYESEKIRLNNDLEFARKKTTDEYNAITTKTTEMELSSKREDELKEVTVSLNNKLKLLKDENQQLLSDAKEYTEAYESSKLKLDEMQHSFAEKQDELVKLRKAVETSSSLMNERNNELFRARSKYEQLEQLIENNDGYFDGVKAILNNKDNPSFKGVIGTVADSIQTKKKHETAIETLLQSSMQFLITENSDAAKSCVNELKSKQLGRATFLPLDLASASHLSKDEEKAVSETEGVMLAIDAVRYNEEVGVVISSLLGRSIIADNMDIGLSFLKSCKSKLKISTLDGELIQSGSISGGASKKQKSGLITRKRELVDFKNLTDSLQLEVDQLTHEISDMKAKVNRLDEDLRLCSSEIDSLREEVQNKRIIYDDVQRKMDSFEEKKQEIEIQLQENKKAIKDNQNMLLTLRLSLDERRKNHESSSELLNKLTIDQSANDLKFTDTVERKSSLVTEIKVSQEEIRQINEYLEDFSEDNESIEDKIERLYKRKEIENAKIEESNQLVTLLQTDLDAIQLQFEKSQKDMLFTKSENAKRHQNIEKIEDEMKEVRTSKEAVEKELNTKNVFLSKRETEKTNVLTRLFEMYEIQEEDISSVERIEIDFAASKKEVEKIKKRISALGSINHAAVEDCRNLEERYGTEKTQLTDIQGAKSDLDKLLKNVEQEMTERFTATFNEIATNFERIFVEMFEGGHAKLSLVDEKDPLSSAIEIIAQPPGKKPQTINSLSGGEKAFTAVSLIFSIISAKPSPFVILDEVDAALDDANVARFARTLSKFSDKSQFIVVTHRRGTMMKCDSIYGVTQESRGVTICFPRSLSELQDKKLS